MISGPQTSAVVFAGSKSRAGDQLRHDADLAAPVRVGGVDRDVDGDPGQALELPPVEQVARRAAAVEERRPAPYSGAVRDRVADRRAERGEADTAGDDDEVAAGRLCDRPRVAERAAHAERDSRVGSADRLGDGADGANGVDELAAADLAETEIGTSPMPNA